jgi:hypothetical protein
LRSRASANATDASSMKSLYSSSRLLSSCALLGGHLHALAHACPGRVANGGAPPVVEDAAVEALRPIGAPE